jgi:hypothetical protein
MGEPVMSVEGVNNHNKLTSKDLEKVDPKKAPAGKSRRLPVDSVEISEKGKENPQEIEKLPSRDFVQITGQEKVESQEPGAAYKQDMVDISWPDPELMDRINEMIERIKEQKEDISSRIEAARILIMRKAYDDNEALRTTAEAILRGENIDDLPL